MARIITVNLRLLEEEHNALNKIKEARKQTWEQFVIGMARETGDYNEA